jgi:beta-lactamase regulating signal transducer with metallopeptidase domain
MSGLLAWLYPGDSVAIGGAVVLLQITVVVAMASVTVRLLKRRAALRHAVWLCALGCVIASPLLAVFAERLGIGLLQLEPLHSQAIVDEEPSAPWVEPMTAPVSSPASSANRETATPLVASETALVAPINVSKVSNISNIAAPADPWRAVGGSLYLALIIGIFFLLLRLLHGIYGLARLRRGAAPLNSPRMTAVLDAVRHALGFDKLPPILTSPLAPGPAAAGILLPCVLLPEGLIEKLDDRQLRDVLIHECAHLLRRDPLIGLLQRLAGAFFWPHPLLPYFNRRLTRAREEVCDDYVLRAGDAPAYARTLLMLSEDGVRIPLAAPGLIDPNWKLEDRVAGLLDPRRTPVTRVHPLTFACLAATRLAACTAGAVVCAGREPAKDNKPATKEAKAADASADVSKAVIEGVVVDEAGKLVADAVVGTVGYLPPPKPPLTQTSADGSFRLVLDEASARYVAVTASAEDGARQGIFKLRDHSDSLVKQARIVLKPSRQMAVRVTDGARQPVEAAAVGVISELQILLAQAQTDAHGMASLRVPRDARIFQVVALKPGVGFDYFENYRSEGRRVVSEPPAEVALTLDGAQSLRVRAVDSADKGLFGVDVTPFTVEKKGKIYQVNFSCLSSLKYVSAQTDRDGLASFEWMGTDLAFPVEVLNFNEEYSQVEFPRENPSQPSKAVVLRLFRRVPISGKVTLPDGKPAANIRLQIEGFGDTALHCRADARTKADGSYSALVTPNQSYIIGITDEQWAATSQTGIVVKEGEPRTGLDFRLGKGTVLRGKVTAGPHDRPAAMKWLRVAEQVGELPPELADNWNKRKQLVRGTETDADGRYAIRVGSGRYVLSDQGDIRGNEIAVKSEETIETNLRRDSMNTGKLTGIVLAQSLDGKPVAEAFIKGETDGGYGTGTARFEDVADEQGRFEVQRLLINAFVYARNPEGTLATIVSVGEDDKKVTILLSDAGKLQGRLIDATGKPLAGTFFTCDLLIGPKDKPSARASLYTKTDEAGRFKVVGIVPGAQCTIWVESGNTVRTLKVLPAAKAEVLDLGDLVTDAKE